MPFYTICGFSIRGYKYSKAQWKPRKGELLKCSLSEKGSVNVTKGKGLICGSVPTELQEVSKHFLRAGGTITAKVKDETPVSGERGAEILCEYIWYGPPEEAKAARNVVEELHKKNKYKGFSFKQTKGTKNKKKKNLQKCSTDSKVAADKNVAKKKQTASVAGPSHETQARDMADGSGENIPCKKSSEQAGPSDETGAKALENGSGENIPSTKTKQGKKTIKRQSDGRADGPEEKIPKKENIKSVKNKQVPKTEKDPTTKHLSKTGNGLKKVKQNNEQKSQPKKNTSPQPCASGNQRPVQKDVNVEVDQRDKEGAILDSEHGKLEFNFVSSESKQPSGSFSDTHGSVEPLLESDARSKISRSVCKIFYPTVKDHATATGFRVGSRYVMTARHVTEEFLEGIKHARETYVIFNYKLDGIYKEEDKYFIKDVVYEAKETDIAVIELLDHPKGMPPHVEHFHSPIIGKPFHLIGHWQGKIMEHDTVKKFIDLNDQNTKIVFDQLQRMSKEHTKGTGYVGSGYDSVYNPLRFLFKCTFTKGASGCPGIFVVGENIYVTTVLLHGYPDWYHDPKMEIYKSNWKDEHCIQQGVNPMAVCEMMRVTHPDLCQDIFGKGQ